MIQGVGVSVGTGVAVGGIEVGVSVGGRGVSVGVTGVGLGVMGVGVSVGVGGGVVGGRVSVGVRLGEAEGVCVGTKGTHKICPGRMVVVNRQLTF